MEPNGQLTTVAADLARLAVAMRAIRNDVEALRREVRQENAELRGDLTMIMSRQNRAIEEAKKKRSWRLCAWSSLLLPHPGSRLPTGLTTAACCTA
jgi:hypothetical protein